MNKKTTTILAVIVLLAMILTGTFAWLQYNQHKTNEASGSGIKYDVSLIENFKEIKNWKVSDPATPKEIRVKNSGLTDGTYGDTYVRLQLKEYMEMSPLNYKYSEQRLMIDTDGKFISFATETLAKADYPDHTPAKLKGIEDTNEQWYIPTKAGDENGQYGKFLLLSATLGEAKPLVTNTKRATDTKNHDLATNGECAYPVHVWKATPGEPEDCGLEFHEYIRWYLSDDVISMDEWDGTPVKKWIYDTKSEEGWVYWGASLAPGETTSNLLEKIQLMKQPDGNFYYAIHVDMEAVSLDELWSDAPLEIQTAFITTPMVTAVTVTSEVEIIQSGYSTNFSATVIGFNNPSQEVFWEVSGSKSASKSTTIDSNGRLTVAADEPGNTVLIVTATSMEDGKTKGEAALTVFSIDYLDNGNGTATKQINSVSTDTTVIIGLDGVPATEDDNQIVNPARKVLKSDVSVLFDSGTPYVDLGNGFYLYPGADGKIGTEDDIIKGFGRFAQTSATGAIIEDLNWRLLDIDADINQAIIVSDQVLDNVKYHTTTGNTTWAACNLRSWLNSRGGTSTGVGTAGFYNTAFTTAEKAKIVPTLVSMEAETFRTFVTSPSLGYIDFTTTKQTNTEPDNVWALSGAELWKYFGESAIDPDFTNGAAKGNAYSKAKGTYYADFSPWISYSDYWLRSPGQNASCASYANYSGDINSFPSTTWTSMGARPALTIKLGS